MKKLLSIACIGILFVILLQSSCKSQSLQRITVGMNVDYPPFAYRVDNEYKGIDVDIVNHIGDKLGVDIEIVQVNFDQLIPSLLDKRIDMIASAMTITAQRAEQIQFTAPYFQTAQTILTSKENTTEITKPEDFAPFVIASQSNTTGYALFQELLVDTGIIPKKNLISYPTNLATISALQDGRCDFAIFDKAPASHYIQELGLVKAYEIDTAEEYGMGFRKDYPHFSLINNALIEMIESGEMATIMNMYGVN